MSLKQTFWFLIRQGDCSFFKTNTKACKNEENLLFPFIYKNSMTDQSQLSFLKYMYILGVNKYSSNLAVMSETGRLPMYFSVIISIVKYLYRLENISEGLLKDSYMSSKHLHHEGLQSWFTSAMYILQLLGLKISFCTNLTLSHLVNTVKRKLIKMYTCYWNQERDKHMNSGKLDTYFSLKKLSAWSLIYIWQIFITEELFVRYALVLTILW